MKIPRHLWLLAFLALASLAVAENKPKLTLDEFFNAVSYPAVALSPDGNSVVIATERADWDQQIFRTDLWLYRDDAKNGSLIQLTQSGHDIDPKWSPDGRWIAFRSERKPSSDKDSDSGSSDDKDDKGDISQIYLISPAGGEAFPVTQGQEEVHTFSWSADSRTIYFATRNPWTKSQKDDYKKQWKDVVQYRTAERGDTIFALDVAAALARHAAAPAKLSEKELSDAEKESDLTPGARPLATSPLRIDDMVTSPDGAKLAFVTNAVNQRQEKFEDVEIYALDLTSSNHTPRQLTHNQAVEVRPHWANDSRHVFFTVEVGDVSGPYRDLQPHLYWVDSEKPDAEKPGESSAIEQWSKDFVGAVDHYSVTADSVLASARLGTEVSAYSVTQPKQSLHKLNSWDGTYETLSSTTHSPRVAFVYSSLQKPTEVYLADSADKLDQARPITSFNHLFTERDLPQGKPYRWKADDGTMIEGMLIYPPGSFESGKPEAKHLPMLTFIHGGPADADGNHFEADWYQWAALAATNGWLVFEPNYRGSAGYGDKFLQQIVPVIVSRPGKDILEGIDALVKDGIADADHLTIGGYSYGGYMTNWLITQTTRFKAAVTGAGAVEHVGNWGNDDTTYDDAYFLGGRPWEAQQRYHDEAAIFQIDKVKTPTHMVGGANDIRVAVLEDYLLEHALYSLGIPNKLLIFPGEGHGLGKNPWHGKIKVREELIWLQKYGGVPAVNDRH
ncbi:MAG: peptidase prolyl oligopeptidase [Candidatus Sulfotelmatobacter sp.]|nr:peptidase prolyl oligopeptidase [Candidatus Sulfotelmatobacter sp.]